MSIRSWWRDRRRKRRSSKAVKDLPARRPLREFVYLDEVSLRSLLVSQADTIPEQVSSAISRAEQAEISSKVSGGSDLVAKGELGSRFQTNNSNTVQTSRKAIVQTLFNELRNDVTPDYALVVSLEPPRVLDSLDDIQDIGDPSVVAPASALSRGSLVEIEVQLDVDPVFKLGMLVSEYASMAEENPGMFDHSGKTMLQEVAPINRVLQRLLAGLIPIRARATNFSVLDIDGCEFVVRNETVSSLNAPVRPLEVVGVTEHLGYWKDIRRVLFSSARVTMLCRVSRDGLHQTWTPVKLADLFRDAVPDLVDQINLASRTGLSGLSTGHFERQGHEPFREAVHLYREKLEEAAGVRLSPSGEAALEAALMPWLSSEPTPSVQRSAFAAVRTVMETEGGLTEWDSDSDFAARKEARSGARLDLFPTTVGTSKDSAARHVEPVQAARLLDVEVVAIYW